MSELNTDFYGEYNDKEELKTIKTIIKTAHEKGQTCFCCDIEDKHSYYLLFEFDCGNEEKCEYNTGDICNRYDSDNWYECSIMAKMREDLELVIDELDDRFGPQNIDEIFVSDEIPNGVYIRFKGWDE